jgi:hypothetical protein
MVSRLFRRPGLCVVEHLRGEGFHDAWQYEQQQSAVQWPYQCTLKTITTTHLINGVERFRRFLGFINLPTMVAPASTPPLLRQWD